MLCEKCHKNHASLLNILSFNFKVLIELDWKVGLIKVNPTKMLESIQSYLKTCDYLKKPYFYMNVHVNPIHIWITNSDLAIIFELVRYYCSNEWLKVPFIIAKQFFGKSLI